MHAQCYSQSTEGPGEERGVRPATRESKHSDVSSRTAQPAFWVTFCCVCTKAACRMFAEGIVYNQACSDAITVATVVLMT